MTGWASPAIFLAALSSSRVSSTRLVRRPSPGRPAVLAPSTKLGYDLDTQKLATLCWSGSSEAEETRELDHKRAVLEQWRATELRVAHIVVDDKEFAARLVFPAQAKVGAE